MTGALCNRVSHKSTNVVDPRFTPRNHAPGHIKSQIFWNFLNPSLKNTLFFEQRFRLQLHLPAVSGTICEGRQHRDETHVEMELTTTTTKT